jgi:hypothetical protein
LIFVQSSSSVTRSSKKGPRSTMSRCKAGKPRCLIASSSPFGITNRPENNRLGREARAVSRVEKIQAIGAGRFPVWKYASRAHRLGRRIPGFRVFLSCA